MARRRAAESTDLSTDAVHAALASVRGDEAPAAATTAAPATSPIAAPVPAPRTSTEDLPALRTPAPLPDRSSDLSTLPAAADGPSAPTSRHALRRAVARTEAQRHEEHLWTRSCRPTSRTATSGGLLV